MNTEELKQHKEISANITQERREWITKVTTEELASMEVEQLPLYLKKNVFRSEYVLGRLEKIHVKGDNKFAFVELLLPYDLNSHFEKDGVKWSIHCQMNDVPDNNELKQNDLIYFKIKANRARSDRFICVASETVKKLIKFEDFLKESGLNIIDIKSPGLAALEKDGENIRIWATNEFYEYVKVQNEELLEDIKNKRSEIDRLNEEKDGIQSELNIKEQEARERIEMHRAEAEEAIKEKKLQEENKIKSKKKKIDEEKKKIDGYKKKIDEKERKVTGLINKLEFFGFKGFSEEVKKSDDKYISDISYSELFNYVKDYLRYNKKLIYDDYIIRRFLTALKSSELVILSGPSGTGKTSIITAFAEAVGGQAKIISVKPSWSESEDLVGFYNPIEKCYVSTPFLDALIDAKKPENRDKLYMICLDEMNLSHVEYYFAEFLSKLESDKNNPCIELYSKEIFNEIIEECVDSIEKISRETPDDSTEAIEKWCIENQEKYGDKISAIRKKLSFIQKYPAAFSIPRNVRFIGTMNIDHTTKSISPKVIDRSYIIELLKFKGNRNNMSGEPVENKFISADAFISDDSDDFSDLKYENIVSQMAEINEVLEVLRCDYNSRTENHIRNYLLNIEKGNMDFECSDILSDLIAMKVLPRVNVSLKNRNDEKYRKWYDLKFQLEDSCSSDVVKKIEKMSSEMEDDLLLSFWGIY